MRNPYEMDLEEDEETGEVILPAGYTGRSGRPYGMKYARERGVGTRVALGGLRDGFD